MCLSFQFHNLSQSLDFTCYVESFMNEDEGVIMVEKEKKVFNPYNVVLKSFDCLVVID